MMHSPAAKTSADAAAPEVSAPSRDRGRPQPGREIGDRIRLLRKLSKMSQTDLARKVGVSTSALGFWETGRPGDAQKHLPMIAQSLGVTVEALLTGNRYEETPAHLSLDEHALVQLYRCVDSATKIQVQKWLETRI